MTDFSKTKALFNLPEGIIYLDGNSLGPLPKTASARIAKTVEDEWGDMLITGWNRAGWMEMPSRIGERIGKLIGAMPGTVAMGDTLSIKIYQALASALEMRPDRKVVLSDTGNFPTDLYMARGLVDSLAKGHEILTVAPEEVISTISEDVAVVMLTHVDYRTGRMHDMAQITQLAHEAGALMIWDLAHSAGAVEVDLSESNADFAAGCTYKYLNSGPGGPAFIYVAPHLQENVRPALSGWLGHAAPFAFDPDYRPGAGVERMRVGTPAILQFAALDAAMDIWEGVSMADVRAKSLELTDLFIDLLEAECPDLTLVTPRNHRERGSQVSFAFDNGYAVVQALIEKGVIGDFRAPDITRFGFTPLYIDENDVRRAAATLIDIMQNRLWDRETYKIRAAVT